MTSNAKRNANLITLIRRTRMTNFLVCFTFLTVFLSGLFLGKDVLSFDRQNDAVIAELITNGPVVAAFDVYEGKLAFY